MDLLVFLNRFWQMNALAWFTKHLESQPQLRGTDINICPCDESKAAYRKALEAGEEPRVIHDAEHGWFVTHYFEGDEDLRLVCWAEMGPENFNRVADAWWKENNEAYREGGLLGVTRKEF